MRVQDAARQHSQWVEAMGWAKSRPLEYLALIASEMGEAVDEVQGSTVTAKFGSEMVDIVLRTLNFALLENIDILQECYSLLGLPGPGLSGEALAETTFMGLARWACFVEDKWADGRWTPSTTLERLALMLPGLAKAMNDCRGSSRPESLGAHLALLVLQAVRVAAWRGVDVDEAVRAKIAANLLRGNKGRLV